MLFRSLLEQKFHLKTVHPDLFGTSDCVIWKPATSTLICADYKHGAGVPVEVIGNLQRRYYSLGALTTNRWPATTVRMAIIQPRCVHPDGPVRTEDIDALDLIDFAAELVSIVNDTEDPDAPLEPSEECRFCNAAPHCPALHSKSTEVAKIEFGAMLSYDPQKLADTLAWLPILENWIKNVREFAYSEAEHGRCAPGWKLVQKRATRKWAREADVIDWLQEQRLLPDEMYDQKLKSVATIEKIFGKGGIPDSLITKESSGFALAPEDDKRPAINADAKSEFEGL